MTTKEKYSLAQWTLQKALNYGAQEVAVIISNSENSHVEIRNQKIDTLEQSIQCSLSIRLYVDNRYSAHSTNRLKKSELTSFIVRAIEGTKYLAQDAYRSLPHPKLLFNGAGADLMINDPYFNVLTAQDKIELAKEVEQEILGQDERLISSTTSYYDGFANKIMLTSNGFKGETEHTYFGINASVSVKGVNSRPEAHWSEGAVFFKNMVKNGVGEKALERALRKIRQQKVPSGNMQMLVENRQVGKLLGPLISALNGSAIQQKNSFLMDKLQQKVVSKKLSLYDNPLLISGRASRHFDNEGLTSKKRNIFKQGVLENYYLDTYYARKIGMQPTTGTTSNLIFHPGQVSFNQLIASVENGILVTGFNGGNCNGSTGDFSYGIEGFLIQKGRVTKPVSEMNITGNMLNLWSNVEDIGNDTNKNSSLLVPSILFNNVDFSGL